MGLKSYHTIPNRPVSTFQSHQGSRRKPHKNTAVLLEKGVLIGGGGLVLGLGEVLARWRS